MVSLFGGVLELSHAGHRSPLIGEKGGVGGWRVRGGWAAHTSLSIYGDSASVDYYYILRGLLYPRLTQLGTSLRRVVGAGWCLVSVHA
jgi:hypothetical protein